MPACDFRGEGLTALDRLEGAKTPDDVMGEVGAGLKPFGIEFFCFSFLARPDEKFEEVMLAQRVPAPWLDLYLTRDFAAYDPSLRHCRNTVHPFEYKDAPYDPESEPKAAEVVRQATDFRMARGFMVPIPSPTGCEGAVWMGGYHLNLGRPREAGGPPARDLCVRARAPAQRPL